MNERPTEGAQLAPGDGRPAPLIRMVAVLTLHELRLAMRRGESLLAAFVIPVVVLWFFAVVRPFHYATDPPNGLLPLPFERAAEYLLAGAVALAIIASSLVALGIATGYDRAYGVLKRLGGSPAPRAAILLAKIGATLAIEVVQLVLLVAVARVLLGWSGAIDLPVVMAALALGTAAFAGLGLALAGALRAEATLAVTNGLFLVALLLGGIIVPIEELPAGLGDVARLLPAHALSDALRTGLNGLPVDVAPSLVLLAAWATLLVLVAAWRFRWE